MFESLWRELRWALRALAISPGFTATAVITLAIGIGANTAIFSIVYGVLLRPLPFPDAASLVLLRAEREFAGKRQQANFSAFELADWNERSHVFASVAGYGVTTYALERPSGVEPIDGAFVSKGFFPTLGVSPATGRLLGPGDDLSPVAVISYRLWLRLYNGDQRVVSRTITLSGHSFTIIGVARPTLRFPSDLVDVWTPIGHASVSGLAPWLGKRRGGGVHMCARLKAGVTLDQARREVDNLGRVFAKERPDVDRGLVPFVTPVADSIIGSVRPALLLLFAAVTLALLVACANLSNLLLARQAFRAREMAVRLALGAPSRRLIAHAVAEIAIVAVAGSGAGILLAGAMVETFIWLEPARFPRTDAIHVDGPVLAFALLVSLAAALLAGLIPAIQSSHQDVAAVLGASARTAGSRRSSRLRSVLVTGELAVSIVLLVGASVLARSLVRLLHTDIGARTDHVLVAELNLSLGRQVTEVRQREIAAAAVQRTKAIPGVRLAALGSALPPHGRSVNFTLKNLATAHGLVPEYAVNAAPVTPDFFTTLGVPLLEGRFFDQSDDAFGPRVMIMSAATASDLFGDDPLGRTLSLPTPREGNVTVTLVGVVGEVKYQGLAEPTEGTVYLPFAQQPWPRAFLIARTSNDPLAITDDLHHAIGVVDPGIGVVSMGSLDEIVSKEAAQPRFRAVVLSGIAGLALALAGIGLYGVVGYSVSRRTAEIGIRVALGADARHVMWMVLREGLRLGFAGTAVGLAGAFLLTRLLASLLFGVTAGDPTSFASATMLLLLVVLGASYIPARRASRVDPIVALREE